SSRGPADTLSILLSTTNGSGQAIYNAKSTLSGTSTFSASSGSIVLTAQPQVTFTAGTIHHFDITSPASIVAGVPFGITVTAHDSLHNPVRSYPGTVTFSSSSTGDLPAAYTFLSGDNGVHHFSNLILTTAGTLTLTVSDSSITGTVTLTVNPA